MEFKSQQSAGNWEEHKVLYIILLVVTVVAIIVFSRLIRTEIKAQSSFKEDGDGAALYTGRGSDYDDTETLINRIEWSTYYESKISRWYRMIIITIIIVALISLLALRKLPKPSTIITLVVLVFIPMYSCNNFYYTHGDVYNDYYTAENIRRLRKRFFPGSQYKIPPPPHPNAEVPTRVQAMNE